IGEPYPVGISAVSNWSLTATGTPWSGLLVSEASHLRACTRPSSGSRNLQAWTVGSRRSIRSRHAQTSSSEEISPERILPAAPVAESLLSSANIAPSSHYLTLLSRRSRSSERPAETLSVYALEACVERQRRNRKYMTPVRKTRANARSLASLSLERSVRWTLASVRGP